MDVFRFARRLLRLLPVCLLLGSTATSEGSLVIAYDTSTNPSGGLAPSETAAGVTASSLTRGSGLFAGPGTSSFSSDRWDTTNTSFADAIADNEILTWGWTNSPAIALSRMEIRYDRTSQGPSQMRIDLAINGGGFSTVYSDPAVPTTGTTALNIDLTAFAGVTSAIFRLVAFGATNTNGSFDIENYQAGPNRGIAVFAAPEPASWAMMSLAVLGIGVFRRQRDSSRT